jgi:hypothetical protein
MVYITVVTEVDGGKKFGVYTQKVKKIGMFFD